jgi:hypothetical protein
MSLNIDDFKAKLIGGGARANLFKVTMNFPGYAGGDTELTSFMVKGASLPASTLEAIAIPFRGRQAFVAGDRAFETQSFTVINDNGMEVRNAFERWMNAINQHNSNLGLSNPVDYEVDYTVEQLNKNDEVTKTYTFRNSFPVNVSQIELSNDSENTIEEFEVEMRYTYWESSTTS